MTTFIDLYGAQPAVTAAAPGRVNLIGEHTDYNDGFVLPAALPMRTTVELSPRDDRTVRVWSREFAAQGIETFPLERLLRAGDWTDYVRGMAWALVNHGLMRGFDARVASDVPVGSGLSSSAALLVAIGRAVRDAFRLDLSDLELARIARHAETEFVGAPVGIMDQMACSLADETSALFIDTRTLAYERVPLPEQAGLLVIDSGVRHSHAGGDYRVRRDECHRAAALLGIKALRDAALNDLAAIDDLPNPLNRRARHVVTENARVLETVDALGRGNLTEVGRLFFESHASMRDDFEVSVPPVDALVETARAMNGVYGARLTGGGFGGAIVAITDRGRAAAIGAAITVQHNRRFPQPAVVLVPERTL